MLKAQELKLFVSDSDVSLTKRISRARAILFDKDGVFTDFHATWSTPALLILEAFSHNVPALKAQLAAHLGIDLLTGRTLPNSIIAGGSGADIVAAIESIPGTPPHDEIVRMSHALLDGMDAPEQQIPVKGLAESLRTLCDRGYVLGMATNDREAPARAYCEYLGVAGNLRAIYGADSGYGAKPKSGMMLAFCEATKTPPEQVIMVGDTAYDAGMARAAGAAACIGVLTGAGDRQALESCMDLVIDSVATLPDLFFSSKS